MTRPGLILACLALAACAAPVTTLPPLDAGPARYRPPGAADACGAAGLQVLIGQPVELFEAQIRPGPKRILRVGEPVTQDFNAKRVNVTINPQNRITAISCG